MLLVGQANCTEIGQIKLPCSVFERCFEGNELERRNGQGSVAHAPSVLPKKLFQRRYGLTVTAPASGTADPMFDSWHGQFSRVSIVCTLVGFVWQQVRSIIQGFWSPRKIPRLIAKIKVPNTSSIADSRLKLLL